MANAKQCDICNKFFNVPEIEHGRLEEDYRYLNLIRMHRAMDEDTKRCFNGEDWIQFDACDECYDKMLDYILANAAKRAVKEDTNA